MFLLVFALLAKIFENKVELGGKLIRSRRMKPKQRRNGKETERT